MKTTNYTIVMTVVSLIFSTKAVFPQQIGIDGNWILKQKTSLSGIDYANTVDDSIKVSKNGNLWTLTRSNMGKSTSETLPESAQPVTMTTKDNRRKTVKVIWTNDHVFTEDRSYSVPGDAGKGAFNVREEFILAADKQTLTVTRYFENPQDSNDKWSAKGEYTRK